MPVLDREVRYCDVVTRREIVPADGLLLAFRLAEAGQTDREIARALHAACYRTSGNRGMNPFTKDTVRPMLQNRFYVGELPDGEGGWLPGKHGALIAPALFAAVQTARERNTHRPLRTAGPGQPWALSGIGVCVCGASMVANGRPNGRRSPRCAGCIPGNGCDAPSFYEDAINAQLATDTLARFVVDDAERERLVAAWVRHHDKGECQRRRAELHADLAVLPAAAVTSVEAGRHLAMFLASLPTAWAEATSEERNRLARQLFAEAIVENRTVVAVKPRPELRPFFEGVTWCVGGSDGGRISTFRTSRADPSSTGIGLAHWFAHRSSQAIFV